MELLKIKEMGKSDVDFCIWLFCKYPDEYVRLRKEFVFDKKNNTKIEI